MVRRTKANAEATCEAILAAAEELFTTRGVSRTTLQHIATAAGFTRGAVYWHFKDKADLLDALIRRARLPTEELQAEDGSNDAEVAVTRLREFLVLPLRRVATDPKVRRAFEIFTHKIEYVDELERVRERHIAAVRQHQGQVARYLAAAGLDPRASLWLHALVAGLINTWMLDPAAFDLEVDGRAAIDGFLIGLRKPQSRA